MTATPTPGDLSEVVRKAEAMIRGTEAEHMAVDAEASLSLGAYLRAALSALPAGGEPVATVSGEGRSVRQFGEPHYRLQTVILTNAEGDDIPPGTKLYTTPPPDAAVGAQGEEVDEALLADLGAGWTVVRDWLGYVIVRDAGGRDVIKSLAGNDEAEFVMHIIRRLAAPAAGKGVDDASERQPDGYAYRYEDGFIRHNGGRDHNGMRPTETIPFYYGSAPALTRQPEGKGVDGLPAKWRATSGAIAKPYGFVTEHVLGKSQALDACADELEAALTRQPVAGDGA